MRALVVVALGLALSSAAAAEPSENPHALVPSVALATGGVGALAPGRGAPALELSGRVGLAGSRWAVAALFDGWTLDAASLSPPATELVGTIGPAIRMRLTDTLAWTAAAGPAIAWHDAATEPSTFHLGAVLAPGLELSTRRRTLSLDVGGRAMFFADGPRFELVAGARYSFR